MMEDKPRTTRLVAIITQLQAKRIVTATEIAKKHGISIRTVYRDIRTLEHSGIPIITEEGKGYSIMEGYTLPPIMLTQEEANALITTEQLIIRNKDTSLVEHYQNAVMKVRSALKFSQKAKADLLSSRIQIRNNPENEKTSSYLIQLQSAIVNYQITHIHYLSLENQQSERFIEPFALYTTQENWILIAFCRLRNSFRAFRLDCIVSMKITDEHFDPHKMTLEQYMEECRKTWKKTDTPDIPLTQV